MKRALQTMASLFVLGLVILWLVPRWAPAQAVAWNPPPNPGLTGVFAPNQALAAITEIPVGPAPEHVACDTQGRLYTSLAGGAVLRGTATGDWDMIGSTGGRPLGLRLDGQGGLWIADSMKGLLHMSGNGDITVLTTSLDGEPLRFVDDLDIDHEGRIWFSDASQRFDYTQVALDFFEGSRTGRLLRYDSHTQKTEVMMDGLFFANGVTLGPNEDYVLVNETGMGRIHRLWLKGDKAGKRDIFTDELPGTPDNIRFDGEGTFWIAMPSLRADLDALASLPRLRALLSFLPISVLEAAAQPGSFVIGVNLEGEVVHNLQDQDNPFHYITGVT
ncbi:MAG: SMP-30/gluconolactonase/LRE family protein, partial [Luminiphilus sp.]|nr:SMP-30/gluconolactonase/LRE family protein [Luminiphilus sp.]